jgi:hypothetical protein
VVGQEFLPNHIVLFAVVQFWVVTSGGLFLFVLAGMTVRSFVRCGANVLAVRGIGVHGGGGDVGRGDDASVDVVARKREN